MSPANPGGLAPDRQGMLVALKARFQNLLRGLKQVWGTSRMKQELWDEEYAAGKWNHCENTSGDVIYAFIEKYCRNGSILDMGCGSGNTSNELDVNRYGNYTGVDVSDVAVQKAAVRSQRNGRADKNRYVQSDFISYVPDRKHDVILFRESIHNLPRHKAKATLDRYSRYLTPEGAFVVRLSRDSTRKFADIIRWLEARYSVLEKISTRESSGAFILVFR